MLFSFVDKIWNTMSLAHTARKQYIKERLNMEYKIATHYLYKHFF